ncbi:MAG: tetratricopeptide repeat protein, partial [Chitinophagaceae bacterium]
SLQPKEEYGLSLAHLLEQKAIDSSISFLKRATGDHPEAVSLQVALVRSYLKNGDDAKALALCDAIVAKFPGQLDALLLKAEILAKKGKEAEATAVLEMAYLLAPGDADLAHHLGFRYAEDGNPKVLLLADSLQRADLNATHAEPFLLRGIYYYNLKKFDDAIRAFDAAIVRDYNFMDAHMYKGQVFYDMKKYTEAAKTFALVTSISPTYADGYYWLGRTQEALQDKPNAKLNYERAFALDKDLLEARTAAERLN